uniref:Single-stranded DNA-binding protein n=1 Tax=Attheya septentrionalis TaxID=420275 RepID=A0A7S2UQ80_9STRA|mmetsp:Transcript_7899/g.14229  ORF Transcript_7899/g.14229 Transcript_7899/m.14229 type:complete len:318 (+) Transcript_7899:135-1088(+)|eukprot:CAMPEP_0198296070 /NCGR_PEP_ID=MMETSP1449-20131203/30834_1 /TAXON_ID=420275 /ORGANISM="Attheya septentrionalis, Strain CCMP2084" /LENGTH=317 /DNA_ID=CAMNT_0043996569 /DNA_START=121 /DNA_END=1074 /DNA_ORIENTATION=-
MEVHRRKRRGEAIIVAVIAIAIQWDESPSFPWQVEAFGVTTTPLRSSSHRCFTSGMHRVGRSSFTRGFTAPKMSDDDDAPLNPGEDIFNPSFSSPKEIPPLPTFGVDDDDDDEEEEEIARPAEDYDEHEDEEMTAEALSDLSGPFADHIPKFNVVTLSGRVGNPQLEPKYFDDGKVVLSLSLAVKRKYHPLERRAYNIKSGDEETDWFALEIWGRDAEYAAKYVEKGSRIGVTGSLVVDNWTDRATGEPRSRPKILVKQLDILETKAEADLRRKNVQQRGSGGYNSNQGGQYNQQRSNRDDDNDGGPSSAGSGGFFD